jgi:hypothetical protein
MFRTMFLLFTLENDTLAGFTTANLILPNISICTFCEIFWPFINGKNLFSKKKTHLSCDRPMSNLPKIFQVFKDSVTRGKFLKTKLLSNKEEEESVL